MKIPRRVRRRRWTQNGATTSAQKKIDSASRTTRRRRHGFEHEPCHIVEYAGLYIEVDHMTTHQRFGNHLFAAAVAGCILWAQWPVLALMAGQWSNDPRYSHGYLVPIFSLALLDQRRRRLDRVVSAPTSWGLPVLILGAALQLLGGYFHANAVEAIALGPYLAGLALLAGGWSALRWAWPSIMFLAFMIPLPWRVAEALGPPLQATAAKISTYLLQTLGFAAFAEGNVIQLNEARIGVAEACSGLSMLLMFIALSTAAALYMKLRLLDRFVLVLSSIPVALFANIARIVLTGILYERAGGAAAMTFYHDLAGWVMIPFALVLYWCEIWVLSRILIESAPSKPSIYGLGPADQSRASRLGPLTAGNSTSF